jgi:hypothetical protein
MMVRTLTLGVIVALSGCAMAEEEVPYREPCTYTLPPISVQVSDLSLGPQNSNRVASLSGTVVRSFNGPHAVGDRVSVDLICSQNSPLILAAGGMSYDCDYYAGSPVLELGYGEEDGRVRRVDIEGGRTGIRRLDAPTDEAVFRVPVGVCVVT